MKTSEPKFALSPFSALKKSLALYLRNFGLFFGYVAWLLIPMAIIVLAHIALPETAQQRVTLWTNIAIYPLILCWVIISLFELIADLQKKKPLHARNVSEESWRRIPTFALLVAFILAVSYIGLLVYYIPGLILFFAFLPAPMFLIFKQQGFLDSIQSAIQLWRNNYKSILMPLTSGMFIIAVIYLLILGFSMQLTGVDMTQIETQPLTLFQSIVYGLVDVLLFPLSVLFYVLTLLPFIDEKNKELC